MVAPLEAKLIAQRDSLAARWQRAIIRTGAVAYSAAEVHAYLLDLVDTLVQILAGDDLSASGAQVGAAVARLGYRSADALEATLELLGTALVDGLAPEEAAAIRPRLSRLLASLAAGFGVVARDQLLEEQEATRAAVLAENRRAWDALRRQAALLDLAPDAILVRQIGTSRIVFWNRGAEALYGWSRGEALGRSSDALLQTESSRALGEIEASLFRDGHWEGELVHARRDGTRLIVSSRWAPQWDDQGQPLACLEINTDISARKQMEATLREREASLEMAQSVAHLGSWQFDLRTQETYWSPEAYRLFGYAEGEVQPSLDAYLQAVDPDDLAFVRGAVEDALAGNSYPFEHRTSGRDGTVRVLQSQSHFATDSSGQPLHLLGTIQDVTERKRAEAERVRLLAEQAARAEAEAAQQRFAFLAEASTRLASSLDYEVTLRNIVELIVPTLADVCALDILTEEGEVRRVAETRSDAAPAGEIERHWSSSIEPHPLTTALRTGESALYRDLSELDGLLNTDSVSALGALGIKSIILAPLVARGRVLGAITYFADGRRAAYRQAERGLAEEVALRCGLAIDNARLHAEAQRATRLRDEFLSVAAHELKTPMTTLRGYSQLLGRTLRDGEAPSAELLQRTIRSIDVQSAKLVTLTEQLLDVSRLESGKLRLSEMTVDLVELVRGVVVSVQETTARHRIRLVAPQSCLLWVDPTRLEQVVANLVGNAVKYSPNGGPLEVTLTQTHSTSVELSVRDWGLGIPPERRANLFDRFYQAHGEGHFGGLGLGLYVSRQIVELHGGSIEAHFPESGGTRFVVNLPSRHAGTS